MTINKHFKFKPSKNSSELYIADYHESTPKAERGVRQIQVGKLGYLMFTGENAETFNRIVKNNGWIITEVLGGPVVGELVDGVFRAATLDDIKDFQRVETKDGIFVVFVNACDPELTKFITNGKDKPTKLVLEEVLAVYSQPAGTEVLNPAAKGKLRYKQIDATEVETLKAQIALAENALAAAKAKLAAI